MHDPLFRHKDLCWRRRHRRAGDSPRAEFQQVHIGWIGVGGRGYYLLERLYNSSRRSL